jgi:hypothetical protein
VRVRPWNDKEAHLVAGTSSDAFFLGDGNFASSSKAATQGSLREVVGQLLSARYLVGEADDQR